MASPNRSNQSSGRITVATSVSCLFLLFLGRIYNHATSSMQEKTPSTSSSLSLLTGETFQSILKLNWSPRHFVECDEWEHPPLNIIKKTPFTGNVIKMSKTAESKNRTAYSSEKAIALTRTLYERVDKSLMYMSALQDKFNKFDRISNQEIHIMSKIHKYLKKSLAEEKLHQAPGTYNRIRRIGRSWRVSSWTYTQACMISDGVEVVKTTTVTSRAR